MRVDLLLANLSRVRRIVRGVLAAFVATIVAIVLGVKPAIWFLMSMPLLLMVLVSFWDRLCSQPAWVVVEADKVIWANPVDSQPEHYQFADLRAYRFSLSKIAVHLTLYLRTGERVSISGRLHKEFWTMQAAFEQAIRRYNQAHPGAEVAWEPSGLTKFFTSSLSTKVLWALLALETAGVAWGISHHAPGLACLPLLFIGLPYLLLWTNFYYERP